MKRLLTFVILSLALCHSAPAAVIYSGLQNIAIPTTFDGVYINIDNAATGTSTITGWDINPFFGGAGIANSDLFQPVRTGTANDAPIVNLAGGSLISSASIFSSGFGGSGDPVSHLGSSAGLFEVGQEGYLGFRFTTDASAGPYYGWMRVVFTNDAVGGLIKDWSYDDSGASITVPVAATPEPSRMLFILLGGMSLCFRRRR